MEYSGFIQKVFQKLGKLDIDKIKEIMVELSTEKELYKLVFDSMIEGVIVTNKDNKVILINRVMEDFISVSKNRVNFQELGSCNFEPEIEEFLNDALANNQKILEEEVHLRRTDKTYTLSILPLLNEGETEGQVIILVDITEKKMREFQLRQAESLAALTTLSAGVAHEIKNPLTSIDIHIQLLNREIQKFKLNNLEVVKNIKNFLTIVKEEIDRLNSIVQDFLFAVRPMSLSLGKENINGILRDLIDFLKYELLEADIEVKLDLDDELPDVVVDSKYLKQALLNIIKNSAEAIKSGGKISIKTEEEKDGDVVIHIMDDGEGIPESIMSKIFEPYFTTRKSGTGLGLVIVYKIIRELGGDLTVKSEEGEGTLFKIKLHVFEKKKKLLTFEENDEGQIVNH
ncbi:MAG: PAS domain-containing protein [Spirochaetes bacterium]|nr:PAS domain-containing protein [Spirochaetota bacterium]